MPTIDADRDACQGYANCVVAAADLFDLDDDGLVVVLRRDIDEPDRAEAEEAVASCPAAALRLAG
jgi:3-phenylpropionate/trans-cinnamate dioxygenase ferredoxin reductase subunit